MSRETMDGMDWSTVGPIALIVGLVVVGGSMAFSEVLRRNRLQRGAVLPSVDVGPPPEFGLSPEPERVWEPTQNSQPVPVLEPEPDPAESPESESQASRDDEAAHALSELDGELDQLAQRLRRLGDDRD